MSIVQERLEARRQMRALLEEHDRLHREFFDKVNHHPERHIDPYSILDLLQLQGELIHSIDRRLRHLEKQA
jgi:hypothetical protein